MEKTDFRKALPDLYNPKARQGFHLVDVPAMRFLMVDGKGNPNTAPHYGEALEALYGVAYALKFASKIQLERDYTVPPLEGLWWADDWSAFTARAKDEWQWTMMIMVPGWIGPAMISEAIDKVKSKKAPPALDTLRVEMLEEGRAVQILHVGPYDDEGPVLARLHGEYLPEHGLRATGKHHEIYLSDPRRAAPEKLRTVLRQPVKNK